MAPQRTALAATRELTTTASRADAQGRRLERVDCWETPSSSRLVKDLACSSKTFSKQMEMAHVSDVYPPHRLQVEGILGHLQLECTLEQLERIPLQPRVLVVVRKRESSCCSSKEVVAAAAATVVVLVSLS